MRFDDYVSQDFDIPAVNPPNLDTLDSRYTLYTVDYQTMQYGKEKNTVSIIVIVTGLIVSSMVLVFALRAHSVPTKK